MTPTCSEHYQDQEVMGKKLFRNARLFVFAPGRRLKEDLKNQTSNKHLFTKQT